MWILNKATIIYITIEKKTQFSHDTTTIANNNNNNKNSNNTKPRIANTISKFKRDWNTKRDGATKTISIQVGCAWKYKLKKKNYQNCKWVCSKLRLWLILELDKRRGWEKEGSENLKQCKARLITKSKTKPNLPYRLPNGQMIRSVHLESDSPKSRISVSYRKEV